MNKKLEDLTLGENGEAVLYKLIRPIGFRRLKKFCPFDFYNKTTTSFIELKTRNVSSDRYPTTIIPKSKIDWFLKRKEKRISLKSYFIVKFTDGLKIIELKENELTTYECSPFRRYDRGSIDKEKLYYFINVSLFSDFNIDILKS
jgi:hypothetical protein